MKEPLCNSIASHFVECGVRELVTHHSLSSLSALLRRLQATGRVSFKTTLQFSETIIKCLAADR